MTPITGTLVVIQQGPNPHTVVILSEKGYKGQPGVLQAAREVNLLALYPLSLQSASLTLCLSLPWSVWD